MDVFYLFKNNEIIQLSIHDLLDQSKTFTDLFACSKKDRVWYHYTTSHSLDFFHWKEVHYDFVPAEYKLKLLLLT